MIWTIIWLAVAALMVVADQITKYLAVEYLAPNGSFELIPGVLSFTYAENPGMAFGLLSDNRWVFMIISTLAIIALVVYMLKWRPKNKFASAAIALIIGGGIGNMIDRMFIKGVIPNSDTYGKYIVRDFIDVNCFGELWPWIFNVADSCVCVGGAMLFVWCVISLVKETAEEKKQKKAKAEEASNDSIDPSENTEEK